METTLAESDRQTPYCTQTLRIKRTDRVTAQLGACWETSSLSLFGFKVFMDARMPVTHEEGDRYPLRPPSFSPDGGMVDTLVLEASA